MTAALRATGLRKQLGGRAVVDGIDVTVGAGEIVGLLGPNGAGKTTAFKLILGLTPADGGEVFFERSLAGLPLHERARLGIGYLPQGPSVFRGLSVLQNLLAVPALRRSAAPEEAALRILDRFHLRGAARQKARSLSGGERRKLEFARALAAEPKIILCDEPFSGVDPIAAEAIAAMLSELADQGIGVLITDHNVAETLSICHRVHILIDGRIVKSGAPEDIRASDRVRRLYLGNRL